MRHTIAGVAMAMGLAACGGGHEIAATPLAGTVGGQPWTFVAGHTSAFLSDGEPDFFAELYAEAFAPCAFSTPPGNHLIVAVPKSPGDYDFSTSLNMTFVVGDSENLVTFDGRIVVDEVTDTLVRGGLAGDFDGDNDVSGQFELTICPPGS